MADHDAPPPERFGVDVDKYLIGAGTVVPCAELIPICKARCCKLPHYLSKQDLAEGVVQWDPDEPYRIAHGADGWCTHIGPETRGCGVYEHRPAICRTYDCRDDFRIWNDFERRIPAPWDRMPDLVQIRLLKQSVRTATGVRVAGEAVEAAAEAAAAAAAKKP